MTEGLVCTVTTVKDTPANLRAFVRRNLAAGADHMFLFLDDGDAECHAALSEMDHVTPIRAAKGYWREDRPPSLNARQFVNANVVNFMLAAFDEVAWLFHIDGDECLDIDKGALFDLEPGRQVVKLQTLEAVSRPRWEGEVDKFKYPLEWDDLCLLNTLGVIKKPKLAHYFNGHTTGKPGVRPSLDYRLGIHRGVAHDGEKVEPVETEAFRVLHYESYSGEEFVRKWSAHLTSGTASSFSQRKDRLRSSISAVLTNSHLSDERKQELLMEVFRVHIQDDVEVLDELGFLMTPSQERHGYQPSGFGRKETKQIRELVKLLRGADKRFFTYPQHARHPGHLVRAMRDTVGSTDRALAERLDAALSRSVTAPTGDEVQLAAGDDSPWVDDRD